LIQVAELHAQVIFPSSHLESPNVLKTQPWAHKGKSVDVALADAEEGVVDVAIEVAVSTLPVPDSTGRDAPEETAMVEFVFESGLANVDPVTSRTTKVTSPKVELNCFIL
jgi:hypothetical protein